MGKIKVAIFDTDKGYRERFADYLMSYKAAEMELAIFTNAAFFSDALNVDKFHLLVLGCGYEEVLARARAKQIPVLVLTEYMESYFRESIEMLNDQVVYVPKYQSMDGITKQMRLMTETKWGHKKAVTTSRELEVVGVFSPVRHEMQMLFSMLYAKNVARQEKVLYINFLEFSGFSEIFGEEEYDVGDAILQIREENPKTENLQACIYETETFSYIAPFINPENVREITGTDVRELLVWISENTDFRTVVLDIGLNVKEFAEILRTCSKIYCLGKKGYLFEAQMRQCRDYLEKALEEAFLERMIHLELPGQVRAVCGGINLLEQLDWGEFGDFVRAKM